jgi:cardiolipin synthase A/B
MQWASFFYLLGGLYVTVTTVFIVMENRRPQATFAWMLLFFSFPGVGVLIYVLFGRDRKAFSRQQKLVRQDLLNQLARTLSPLRPQHERAALRMEAEAGAGAAIAKLVRHTSHSVLTTENRLEVLQDAAETYPRLIEDMKAARSSIHLQFFSWSSDSFGQKLKGILLAKAAEGVKVRLLYDPVGSFFMLSRRYVREMRKGGIEMQPVSAIWRLHTISYRNHRKIAVIDGTIGYTGGLNIGQEHIDGGPGFDCWRDTHLRVVGAAVSLLQGVFAVDWRNAVGDDLLTPCHFRPPPAPAAGQDLPVQITLSGPDSEWQAIRKLYFSMIVAARRHVRLQSPFFILDESITDALTTAALKGVKVQIMVSERGSGQIVPYWAANTYMLQIARAGAEIFLYREGYLHAKTMSIDSEICSIGSANIDIRSFSINYELNAVIYDESTARELEAAFGRDLAHCVRFTPEEYRQRSWFLRLRDSVARLFSPLL